MPILTSTIMNGNSGTNNTIYWMADLNGKYSVYYNNNWIDLLYPGPNNFEFLSVCCYRNIIYIYGDGTGSQELWSYTPLSNSWLQLATNTGAVQMIYGGLVGAAGNIYVVSGMNTSSVAFNALWIYNIATNTWSAGPNMPFVLYANTVVVNDIIYQLNATDYNGGTNVNIYQYAYDPKRNAWQILATNPVGGGVGPTMSTNFAVGNYIYCVNGTIQSGGGVYNHIQVYNTVTNQWISNYNYTGSSFVAQAGIFGFSVNDFMWMINTAGNVVKYDLINNTFLVSSIAMPNFLNAFTLNTCGVIAPIPAFLY